MKENEIHGACGSYGEEEEASVGKTLQDLGIDGRIMLQLIVKKQDKWVCAAFMWPRIGMSGICFEHINECLIYCRKFLSFEELLASQEEPHFKQLVS